MFWPRKVLTSALAGKSSGFSGSLRKRKTLLQNTCPRTAGRGGLMGMSQAWHSWRTLSLGLLWTRVLLISEAVENEIDKITEGVIPEFRDSLVKWGAVVVCAANEASRDWLRDRLLQLVPWEGANLKMVTMGELKEPQCATLSIPGKYDFPTIKAKLKRRCPDLGVEVCMLAIQAGTEMSRGPV